MRWYRGTYVLKKTVTNLRDHFKVHLLTAATVGVTLTILGVYLLLQTNLRGLANSWGEQVQVIAYLGHGLSAERQRALQALIRRMPEVEGVVYRSPAEAMEALRVTLGEHKDILEGLDENPLPGSFEIKVKKEFYKMKVLEAIALRLRQEEGITDVQYGGAWMERFLAVLKIVRVVGISLGVLLLFATLAIISNTLRLAFYARREEIEIMRLVGATEFFINLPLRLEAMVQGGLGGLISLGVLYVLYRIFLAEFRTYWSQFGGWGGPVFLDPVAMVTLVVLGLLLGLTGSFLRLERAPDSR
jgi:cell division transport system permease protein